MAAIHRDGWGRFAPEPPPQPPKPVPRYRVTVFGQPRGPWRESYADAMGDAIDMELASYDRSRREHFLAVPVSIETGMALPALRHVP